MVEETLFIDGNFHQTFGAEVQKNQEEEQMVHFEKETKEYYLCDYKYYKVLLFYFVIFVESSVKDAEA